MALTYYKMKNSLPSIRKFGVFIIFIFSILVVYMYSINNLILAKAFVIFLAVFTFLCVKKHQLIHKLNESWYKLGILVGTITSPIVLGIIFYGLITPISLISRFLGRDTLKLKKVKVKSYWVERDPQQNIKSSLKNQY